MERVVEVTVDNPFFRGVGFESLCDVHDAMHEVRCKDGEVLLERGAAGRAFYVVDSGSFVERTADGEEVRRLESPNHFGEVELIYNCARGSSITCLTAGRLWALDGATFLKLIVPEVSSAAAQSAYTPPPPPLSPRSLGNRPAVELNELMQTPALLGKGAFGAVRLAVHTISGVPCECHVALQPTGLLLQPPLQPADGRALASRRRAESDGQDSGRSSGRGGT